MSARGTSLEGRVAIVSGAGQGVGEGIARRLAQHGAIVVIAARRAETGEPVAASIRDDGGRQAVQREQDRQRRVGAEMRERDDGADAARAAGFQRGIDG